MKTMKFFAAFALVATLSTQPLFANELPFDDVIISSATEAVMVNLGNVDSRTISIKIVNDAYETIYVENVKNKSKFLKKYNMTKIPDGYYTMIVTKENSRITQPFSVQNNVLSLSETDKKVTYFPTVYFKENIMDVNAFLGYYGSITVNILDEKGDKIFSQKNNHVMNLHKRYNVSDLPRGNYEVQVIAGDEAFNYPMSR